MPQQPESTSLTSYPAHLSAATVGAVPTSAFWWQWPWRSADRGPPLKGSVRPRARSRRRNSSRRSSTGHLPRLLGAHQLHPLIAQGEQAGRLEAHDGHSAGGPGGEALDVEARVLAGLLQHSLGDERPAAAFPIDQLDR